MTKGPILFLIGIACGLCVALMAYGMFLRSVGGIFCLMGGQLGATLLTLLAAWVDTRKD